MASLKKSMRLLRLLEYGDQPIKFLHKNKKEHNFTCGGIYKYANPLAIDWDFVYNVYVACGKDIKRTSIMLYQDKVLRKEILNFCKTQVWDKMRLDEVESQKVADEMFLFAFHTHWKTSARVAQRVIGCKVDGFMGKNSLKAINSFDSKVFDIVFDEREGDHYRAIIKRKPELQFNYVGWINRSKAS